MDTLYDKIFGSGDDEYKKKMSNVSVDIYDDVLKYDLTVINEEKLSILEFTKFKHHLINMVTQWGVPVFTYTLTGEGLEQNIGINFELLENKPNRYFQIHMAFEDAWFGEPLYDVWSLVCESD